MQSIYIFFLLFVLHVSIGVVEVEKTSSLEIDSLDDLRLARYHLGDYS